MSKRPFEKLSFDNLSTPDMTYSTQSKSKVPRDNAEALTYDEDVS